MITVSSSKQKISENVSEAEQNAESTWNNYLHRSATAMLEHLKLT